MPWRAYCRTCDAAVDADGPWPGGCTACRTAVEEHPVADVIGPRLRVLFCGINPGVQTARARHHFANPQNPFWAFLHEAGFTPRRLDPSEERELPRHGVGITNAVTRATPGSGDVRGEDVAHGRERLHALVRAHAPAWVAFVGKQAHEMATGIAGAPHGAQRHRIADARVYVLPSTSPANASVPRAEKLRWFANLRRTAEADRA